MRTTNQKSEPLLGTIVNSSSVSGLILAGVVKQRTKRVVPVNNPTTEIVTYLVIDTKEHHHYVDDYAPDKYYELEEYVQIPVFIKPYIKKNGEPAYSLNVLKPFRPSTVGVSF